MRSISNRRMAHAGANQQWGTRFGSGFPGRNRARWRLFVDWELASGVVSQAGIEPGGGYSWTGNSLREWFPSHLHSPLTRVAKLMQPAQCNHYNCDHHQFNKLIANLTLKFTHGFKQSCGYSCGGCGPPITWEMHRAVEHMSSCGLNGLTRSCGYSCGGYSPPVIHPVSVRRFPSFRTQPLENLTPLPMNKSVPEQPSPWRKSSKRESCYGDRVYEWWPYGPHRETPTPVIMFNKLRSELFPVQAY